jgi:hypothetical protein
MNHPGQNRADIPDSTGKLYAEFQKIIVLQTGTEIPFPAGFLINPGKEQQCASFNAGKNFCDPTGIDIP